MNKKIIMTLGLAVTSLTIQMIDVLPWWSFCAVLFLLGIILPNIKWKHPSFLIGFISGFSVWVGMDLYYESVYEGAIMSDISIIFGIPYILILLIIGCIGGVLSALSFYSGSLVLQQKIKDFKVDN